MRRELLNLVLAGLVLAALEVAWVLARAGSLFLSWSERIVYALASASGLASCVLLLGVLLALATGPTRGTRRALWTRIPCALGVSVVAGGLAWSLSEGRRVRDLPARMWVVGLLAVSAGAAMLLLLAALARARQRLGTRVRGFVCLAAALGAGAVLLADALILPRAYPAFHLGLLMLAVGLASSAGLLAPTGSVQLRRMHLLLLAAGAGVLLAPLLLRHLAAHPTASFAVRESAPWTRTLMQPFAARARAEPFAPASAPTPPAHVAGGVDLRDRDVLLITVDALRADVVRAYGGTGVVPEIDRLAREGAVFTRAYTPAPHTSYALASLLTGKFVKPLIELGGTLGDPPTLPDSLRRYGYRTAAFYPPAVFFVDSASFEALRERGFGFEYRKEMFASADQRVAQLDAYLVQAEPNPLFVWVHLFEPHEPYAPPPDIAHDGSARGRYEAEVRASDRAIAKLVSRFRAARPNATVIVTADHGEEFGDHGGSFHGSSLYDEQVRIPLVWSSPGVVAPREITAPVELTDVGTTILSTAAIPRDARMQGDDLGGLLAGRLDSGPEFAFASIDGRHMVTDGRMKAICATDAHCALFDLAADARETRNLAAREPERTVRLRAALDGFLASVPRVEALAVTTGVALPAPLARAKLGGAVTSEELLPLLVDARPAVRRAAARVLGDRGLDDVRPALERARLHDEDAGVRAEAAIAALRLGHDEALADVLALLGPPEDAAARERQRLAALAVARLRRGEALPVLSELARDTGATELERLQAIRALAEVGTAAALEPLLALLSPVRLRKAAAEALGALGDPRAIPALHAQLAEDRYPPSRTAEAEALVRLGDPGVTRLIRRALGRESSIPEGVRLLSELGALDPSSRHGALLRDATVREGSWECGEGGCVPDEGARVVLPRRGAALGASKVRVVFWYRGAATGAVLRIDGERFSLPTGEGQLSVERSAESARGFSIEREGSVALVGLAVVPSVAELPPPAPEPWDGGVPPSSDASPTLPSR